MTDALAHVWAKSPSTDREQGELLTAHTGQLLGRLRGWRDRNPGLASVGARADLFDLVAWAIVLHDVGKAARGFQAMLRGGGPFDHRHEVLSLALVGKLDVDDETLGLVAAGVGTHHKDLRLVRELYPFAGTSRDELLAELSPDDEEAWEAWLGGAGAPRLERLGFAGLPARRAVSKRQGLSRALAALGQLAGRLGEEAATSPLGLTTRSVRGLVMLADHAGSAHEPLRTAGSLGSVAAFVAAAGRRLARGLEPHQRSASETVGSALLVAPTGSGKTEGAFLWAARQHEAGRAGAPVFYVLPYRASLDAMRTRIPSYGVDEGGVVLQHATATASLYGQLLAKGYAAGAAARAAKHERNLGRLMTAPVRVLTPYQLLRAFFGLPGHEAVLTDAAGGLFVLDELHAYDLERLALILAAVRHLVRDLGARVFAMSATFPRVLADALRGVLGESTRIDADAATQARFVRHTLRIRERDLRSEATAAEVRERFARGEAVLVVASTVGRAQALYDGLRSFVGGDGVSLLHGRFTGRDRGEKERALADRVGTGRREEGARGTILVATQVVEVSLDVDFDALFTDPAPVEALVQRFGRVNRGLRGGLRDVVVHTRHAPEAEHVYARESVERALEVLRPRADRPVEERDVQRWVDATYEPIADRWAARLADQMTEVEAAVIRSNRALDAHPELSERFAELFDGAEVVPSPFAEEYARLLADAPLEAVGLRVPVSLGQRNALKRRGLLSQRGEGPRAFEVATVPYTEERGLELGS